MAGIGIITLFSQQGGYALAGAISATFVLTYALLSPQISRYVDRYGQLRFCLWQRLSASPAFSSS
ncbi:Uncharacterised protein [Raoultella terrigena]|uniref:Uncharacterized protein n=1 Tax=Raoultella terrigena TaxID=577 RepID=A0A4U9CTI3_RAOTE|nr:Uncharacterised protein [Raoultella terrigena]